MVSRYSLPLIAVACTLAAGCGEPEIAMTPASDLHADAERSGREALPIVIFVSQHDCPYCEALRTQVVYPMIRGGEFENRALLREVSLDPGRFLTGFDDKEIEGRLFADAYGASVTPTLLFLGPDGTEIAKRIVGISNIEYYPFYLNKAIDGAREALQQ